MSRIIKIGNTKEELMEKISKVRRNNTIVTMDIKKILGVWRGLIVVEK